MGKHIQEDSYYGKQGFSLIKIGDNAIAPENTQAILEILVGYGMSIQTIDNKLKIETTVPFFVDKEW